jgi:GTP1/Obg family GTP-binding protein
MKNIKIVTENNPDIAQLTQFMQGIDIVTDKDSYVKSLTSIANYHILALDNER